MQRLQVRVRESLDCVSDKSLTFRLLIHLGVLVLMHVHVPLLCPLPLRHCPLLLSLLRLLLLLHMRALHPCMVHNSWSDTFRVRGPSGTRRVKGGVSSPAEDLRPVVEVGRGKISAGRRCTGTGCRFTSQEATRHWYQAKQGKCGHTFPPPGGSWYPTRVTWIRIGHQANDGLDEGVWNRTVGDLGAKGYRQDLYVPCQS